MKRSSEIFIMILLIISILLSMFSIYFLITRLQHIESNLNIIVSKEVDAYEKLHPVVNGKDGYTPIKGIDYFDGVTPVKGKDYSDGKNGMNGHNGKDGRDGIKGDKGDTGSTPLLSCDMVRNAWLVRYSINEAWQLLDNKLIPCTTK